MATQENIDIDEIKKFSSRAQQWWDAKGEFKTLHDINPVRLAYIENVISLKDKKVLDIGCGGGLLSEAMALQGAIVTGIDVSNENILIASEHAKNNNIEIRYDSCTAEEFSINNIGQYDLITCMELLEHVPEPESIIKACSIMIKPGGHVILSTINRNLKAYTLAVLTGEYLFKLLPKGTHNYEKFIRPSELVNWCQEYGLFTNDIKGLNYNPLFHHCSLGNKPDVNYLIDTIATGNS